MRSGGQLHEDFLGKRPGLIVVQTAEAGGGDAAGGGIFQGTSFAFGEFGVGGDVGERRKAMPSTCQ